MQTLCALHHSGALPPRALLSGAMRVSQPSVWRLMLGPTCFGLGGRGGDVLWVREIWAGPRRDRRCGLIAAVCRSMIRVACVRAAVMRSRYIAVHAWPSLPSSPALMHDVVTSVSMSIATGAHYGQKLELTGHCACGFLFGVSCRRLLHS